ncbi:MAG: polysaccharide deacetylase family protein [Spirochaetales bacterium]|nr:polysaccharide deacetylase family protein [Spirochaetales bacterium]
MKYRVLLFFLTSFSLFAGERTFLFLPRLDHPFYLNSSTGSFRIDELGDPWPQVMTLNTDGEGTNLQVVANNQSPFSLEGQNLVIWVKGENLKELREFWIYGADNSDFANRIVFMPSNDPTLLREGEWQCLSLPLSAGNIWGTPDLSQLTDIQFWVNDRGNGPVSLQIGPVYLEEAKEESALILTFDDGWKSQIETAAPIMAGLGLKGTAYIIPEMIGLEHYMDEEDLVRLTEEFGWSLGGHHIERMDQLPREEMVNLFEEKALWADENNLEMPDFSYANGAFNQDLLSVVEEYYQSGRTIIEYPEANPPGNPYQIKVLNLVPPLNFDLLQSRLEKLAPKGELLVLVLHKIEDVSQYETELSREDFTKLCTMVADSGKAVKTMAQVSADFSEHSLTLEDWNGPTLYQPAAATAGASDPREKTNLSWDDQLHTSGAGHPEALFNTQINYSLDWKMVWGLNGGEAQYYNQLEDLYVYVQNDLSNTARLYSSVGIEDVNFDDLTEGGLDGSQFYLNTLYLKQPLPEDITLTAGYFSPDPHHKWLQVSRSVKIEPAFAQEITPRYLWLQGEWTGYSPFGFQFAMVPDVIGKDVDDFDQRVLTYDTGEDMDDDGDVDTYLGVLNLFTSLWYDTNWLDGEVALALNGDALKVAAEGAINLDAKVVRLAGSLGVKYTQGENCYTYPTWEHEDGAWRYSTGLAGYLVLGEFTLNPGYAYQMYVDSDGSIRHLYGMDVGFLYRNTEFYTVVTFFDLTDPTWGLDAGFEVGYAVNYDGVKFITGYTMGGFSASSGLYGNTDDVEGGVDGIFLRIKATYW